VTRALRKTIAISKPIVTVGIHFLNSESTPEMDADYVDRLVQRGVISDDVAARMMTHQPEQPNPAQPYLDKAAQYARTGLGFATGGLQGAGALSGLPNWTQSNPIQRAVQNPDNAAAMGMANPTPVIAGNPKMIARFNELLEQGHGTRAIADELGISRSSVRRWLERTDRMTAAKENPVIWGGYPEAVDDLRQGINEGKSFEKIANKIGVSPRQVWDKFKRLKGAGEFPDYDRISNQDRALLKDPEKRADLIRLAKEGTSQGDIASYLFGGPGGAHPRRGHISQFIKQLQDEGELQDYVPQGGTGVTAAGRTPTLPQLKSQTRPITPEDLEAGRDFTKAMRPFLPSGPQR
jgi:biotin operon repressor